MWHFAYFLKIKNNINEIILIQKKIWNLIFKIKKKTKFRKKNLKLKKSSDFFQKKRIFKKIS